MNNQEKSADISRRDFIKGGLLTAATAAAFTGFVSWERKRESSGDPSGAETVRELNVLQGVESVNGEDPLVVMQRDLVRAMRKPMEKRHWSMLIDTRKCVGCQACSIACVAENKLPPGVVYRPLITENSGRFPHLDIHFTPRPCLQCENPSCVPVCPVHATWKRADGVVVIDYDKCIGCRYCLTACPYGARTSDFDHYYNENMAEGAARGPNRPLQGDAPSWEEKPSLEYGKKWDRANHGLPVGAARKCHFCLHRLENGALPMCVSTCIGRATYFGDDTDPDSLTARLLRDNSTYTLLEHRGTEPTSVQYIK